jgi:hypothetical protein
MRLQIIIKSYHANDVEKRLCSMYNSRGFVTDNFGKRLHSLYFLCIISNVDFY